MYLVVPPGGCYPDRRRIELGPGALTIGRAESCEIRVDVPGVDQTHAKISEVALVALGPDCAVGDVPLDPGARRLVMPGDEIQIGSIVVALEGDDPNHVPRRDSVRRLGSDHVDGARIRVVEGATFGDELLLEIEGREYLIGRGAKCDLVLDDREVSREHLKVVRRGHAVFVKDLSSTRGSWLGRSAVYTGATVEWSRPRMLRVGATVLSLELPEAARRAAPAAQASAPMTPPPVPRKPGPDGVSSSPFGGPPHAHALHHGGGASPSSHPPAAVSGPAQDVGTPQPLSPLAMTAGPSPSGLSASAQVAPSPYGVSAAPTAPPKRARKAWKKTGPTIGKVSGLLLLALAGLAILGALFVVFSLLE